MRPRLRNKFDALLKILALHAGQRGVIFFRHIKVLREALSNLQSRHKVIATVHGERSASENDNALSIFRRQRGALLLITRDTGKRGLDLPEADYAIFYSPKAREDVTWQEVSRIRSTVRNIKETYILYYLHSGEEKKMNTMIDALVKTSHSKDILKYNSVCLPPNSLSPGLDIPFRNA